MKRALGCPSKGQCLLFPCHKYRLSNPFYFVAPAPQTSCVGHCFSWLHCKTSHEAKPAESLWATYNSMARCFFVSFLLNVALNVFCFCFCVLFSYWAKTVWSADGSGWPWNASLPLLPDFTLLQAFFALFKHLFWDVCVCLFSSQIDAISGLHIHTGCELLCRGVLFVVIFFFFAFVLKNTIVNLLPCVFLP